MELKHDIFYEDNFLPDFYINSLKEEVMRRDFPWYYVEDIAGNHANNSPDVNFLKNQYGFFHTPFQYAVGWGMNSSIFRPVIHAIEDKFDVRVDTLLRFRIGMLTNVGESGCHYPHVDFNYPHTTVLVYLNDSDGDTVLFNEVFDGETEPESLTVHTSHAPVYNRALKFYGLQYHSSSAPTKNERRLAMNINFISG